MSRQDHATSHALLASKLAGLLPGPREADPKAFAAELQEMARLRHAELACAQATIFRKPPSILIQDGWIQIFNDLPEIGGGWAKNSELGAAPFLHWTLRHGLDAIKDTLRIKFFGRRRVVESYCRTIFAHLAKIEARWVAGKIAAAPPGWARLVERHELGEAAGPAKAASAASDRL